ncbi:hypothetical protein [Neisseria sp. S1]|uniref:hypothetical protein n=1 Tax=Neisseria sp. S1 TaxID=3318354 RepID=UPI003A88435C
MSKEALGILFLPAGILSMCMAALWQMYVVVTESYPLNRYKEWRLVGVVTALFFSFSIAIYWFCPNARRKGIIFALLGVGGLLMYILAKMWLPWKE